MSYAWAFYSFSKEKFDHFFGHATPAEEAAMIEGVTWEEGNWPTGNELTIPVKLVHRIARNGLSYIGLTSEEAIVLDEVVQGLFTAEGLGEELEMEPESPDFLSPSVIEELLRRGSGKVALNVLPILQHGRRYGENKPNEKCEYVILLQEDIKQIRSEVQAIFAFPLQWADPNIARTVEDCLLRPLNSAIEKARPLIGKLG